MSKEQRINSKFCFKIGKNANQTYDLLKMAYGNKCIARTEVFKLYKQFTEGREAVNNRQSLKTKSLQQTKQEQATPKPIPDEATKKVRNFLKSSKVSSVKAMETELKISTSTIHRILTEKLGLRRVISKFHA